MITVIRTKIISDRSVLPAGEVFYFNGVNECSECCTFMWGKSIENYLLFRNGYPVDLTSDLYELERRLEIYND